MNLTAVPSLQKIVLLTLSVRVCKDPRIKPLIKNRKKVWSKKSRQCIMKVISRFKLPERLRVALTCFIKPVIIEIISWILYICHIHNEVSKHSKSTCSCLTEIDLQENLHWRTVGLLDKHLITLDLIRDERLDIAFRFVLACSCCSETDILALWQMLPEKVKKSFMSTTFMFLPVVDYWTDRLKKAGECNYEFIPNPSFPCTFQFEYSTEYINAMCSFYEKSPYEVRNYLFGTYGSSFKDLKAKVFREIEREEYTNRVTLGLVNVDNVTAMRYFLKKFEHIKKQILLEVVARNHFINNELLVFCLSQMTINQIKVLLRSGCGSRVLSCFMNSPWQETFSHFVDSHWSDLRKRDFIELMNYVFNFKLKKRWRDFDYTTETVELYDRCFREFGRLSN